MTESTEVNIGVAVIEAKAGNKEAARKALSGVVRQEPNNARAWYLLSQVIEEKERVIYCLQKVLELLPGNQQAIKRLNILESSNNTSSEISPIVKAINKAGFPGYVYVLSNPSVEGLVKIGKTAKDPEERARELSSATGVPTPFIIVYQAYFNDCDKAEIFVQTKLYKYRVANNREFFKVAIPIAVDTIIDAKNYFSKSENIFDSSKPDNQPNETDDNDGWLEPLTLVDESQEPGQEMFDLGDAYYCGLNDTIQDYDEAFSFYQKAARLGYAEAFLQMGYMYCNGLGRTTDNKRALECYKEAIKLGNDEGWGEMAKIFNSEGHRENEAKCWNKYFSSENFLNFRFQQSLCIIEYVSNAISQNKPVEYKDQIRQVKNEVLDTVNRLVRISEERGYSNNIENYRKVFMVIKEL